jgi:hypothetical protein
MCIFFCRWPALNAAKHVGRVGLNWINQQNGLDNLKLDGDRFAIRGKEKKQEKKEKKV